MCIYLLLQFLLSAFGLIHLFLIYFKKKKKRWIMPRHTLDQTSVMRLAYCVLYKPNMLHNTTRSVYGQHQDVSGHRIARHMFDEEKRAVVEGTKKKEKKNGGNTFISPAITTMCIYFYLFYFFWQIIARFLL